MAEHLKKEFQEGSELQRMRNLINKKYGDNTKIQKGYEKETIERIEGDVWEENGKTWTFKNGIKISYSATDAIREFIKIPLWCPSCGGQIKNKWDKKMYTLWNHCFDCQIKIETKMKFDGTFEKFEEEIIKANVIQIVKDVEDDMKEYLKSDVGIRIMTADGTKENWEGDIDKDYIVKEVKEMTEAVKETFEIKNEDR